MTYGVYTTDLSGQSLGARYTIEECKEWCWGDHVVCSEKYKTTGFALHIEFSKYWEFKFRPRWNCLNLGYLHISWATTRLLWADKIVWRPENKEAK